MLYVIGLGLFDENDISMRALDALKDSEIIFCEFYTNKWHGNLRLLEHLAGKKIQILGRNQIESGIIITEAKTKKVALLVPGDPLSATTHFQFLIDCKKTGIPIKIIHSSSIFTAVAETGLQIYKFGRTTTLVSEKNFKPRSPLNVIEKNLKNNLHSLVLLDINMNVMEALKIIKQVADNVLVCSKIGSDKQKIRYGSVEELMQESFEMPSVILIPGDLNFKEQEALKLWKKN